MTTPTLVKGRTYKMTVSGVDLTGKVTSHTPDGYVRLKITHYPSYTGYTSYSILTVRPDAISVAVDVTDR